MIFKWDSLEFIFFLNICLTFVKIKKEIMRKIFAIFILLLSVLYFSQGPYNRFSDEKDEGASEKHFDPTANPRSDVSIGPASGDHSYDNPQTDTEADDGTPNPGDPVPIDNYLPVLLITASGMIVYFARKRKELKF